MGDSAAEVAEHTIYSLVVLQEPGTDEAVIQHLGAIPRDGSHAPQQEETLGGRARNDPISESTTSLNVLKISQYAF